MPTYVTIGHHRPTAPLSDMQASDNLDVCESDVHPTRDPPPDQRQCT
jgi:hypothetical protein